MKKFRTRLLTYILLGSAYVLIQNVTAYTMPVHASQVVTSHIQSSVNHMEATASSTATAQSAAEAPAITSPDPIVPDMSDIQTLTTPQISKCTATFSSTIRLAWNKIPHTGKYEIYRAKSRKGEYKCIAHTRKPRYTDKTGKVFTTYYYKVKAVPDDSQTYSDSRYSKVVSATVRKNAKKIAYVGDSIMTGFRNYGVIKGKNNREFAKIGIHTYNFYTSDYMKNLLHGDFGISLKTGRSIAKTIRESFAISAKLGLMAVVVALVFGIVLGCLAALKRNTWIDHVIIFFVTLFTAMPSFVAASFLLLIFCIQLGWVPVWSTANPNYVLPVIALSLSPMATITRLTKTSMLDALGQDYVRTAYSKGNDENRVLYKHVLKNALIPVVTFVAMVIAEILAGSIVVEQVFSVPGIGRLLVSSISNRDYPVVQAIVVILAFWVVLAGTLADLLNQAIDPRLRLGGNT